MARYYVPDTFTLKDRAKLGRGGDVLCAECDDTVTLYTEEGTGRKYLACLNYHNRRGHEGIRRPFIEASQEKSLLWRQSEMTQESKALVTIEAKLTELGLPSTGKLTGPQALQVCRTVWPDAPLENIQAAAILCASYGLHPLAKHVYLIPFNKFQGDKKPPKKEWVMVMGISANRLIASRTKGRYSFIDDTPRMATDEEARRHYGQQAEELLKKNYIGITKLKAADNMEASGFGLWPKEKHPQGEDKGNTAENMAMVRSERAALEKLTGGDTQLPKVKVVDERYMETPAGRADTVTGELVEEEVVEGEATEVAEDETTGLDEGEPDDLEIPAPEPAPAAPFAAEADPVISKDQLHELNVMLQEKGKTAMELGQYCNAEKSWNIKNGRDLRVSQYNQVIAWLNGQ